LFVYIFLAPNFLMTLLQDAIRLLPGDRILAFSNDHMMIYSFVTTGEAGVAPPIVTPHVTEPLWKLPLRKDFCGLSQGLQNETATLFVVNTGPLYGLIIPHDEHQTPHFQLLMVFNSSKYPKYAIGFEKAFFHHADDSITRLAFSWEAAGEAENVGSRTCSSVVFRDSPRNGARIPQLDEETGRIVQVIRGGFWVIDTALVYT
jgi:hypothetical protein